MRPWQLLVAYMSGGLLRGWLAALILGLVASPFAGGVSHPALTVLALIIGAAGVITGMWPDTFDHAFIANVFITPLALVAGVFYAAKNLAQPWQTLTHLDPIYYLVDATRHGYTGIQETTTWMALTIAAVVAATVLGASPSGCSVGAGD